MKSYTKKKIQYRKKHKNTRKRGQNLTNISPTTSASIKKIFRDKHNTLSQSLHVNSKKEKTTNISNYNVKHSIKRKVGHNKKGGFKTDIVDNLEDRDDDWIITKQ
jgi:sRNA-binding protein